MHSMDHNKRFLTSMKSKFGKGRRQKLEDEENEEAMQTKPMELFQTRKERRGALNEDYDDEVKPHSQIYGSEGHSTDENRMYGESDFSNDEDYDSIPSDDDEEYEDEQKKEFSKDTGPQLSKSQRKRLAVSSLSRKMSKPKK